MLLPDAPLLEVSDLHVGYGELKVVKGISFAVESGEIVVMLGANGAGKTTTMHSLAGLISPSQVRQRSRMMQPLYRKHTNKHLVFYQAKRKPRISSISCITSIPSIRHPGLTVRIRPASICSRVGRFTVRC
jgi:ABC-type branched-subunit amino acid transport system ATPase component